MIYDVYTDGAYSKNKRGGWAFIVVDGDSEVFRAGGVIVGTTSQRAELTAALKALEWIDGQGVAARIISDSAYLTNCFLQNWHLKWRCGGVADGNKVKNEDLWEPIIALHKKNAVQWKHVKGHNGDKWNEEADELAVSAKTLMKSPS